MGINIIIINIMIISSYEFSFYATLKIIITITTIVVCGYTPGKGRTDQMHIFGLNDNTAVYSASTHYI